MIRMLYEARLTTLLQSNDASVEEKGRSRADKPAQKVSTSTMALESEAATADSGEGEAAPSSPRKTRKGERSSSGVRKGRSKSPRDELSGNNGETKNCNGSKARGCSKSGNNKKRGTSKVKRRSETHDDSSLMKDISSQSERPAKARVKTASTRRERRLSDGNVFVPSSMNMNPSLLGASNSKADPLATDGPPLTSRKTLTKNKPRATSAPRSRKTTSQERSRASAAGSSPSTKHRQPTASSSKKLAVKAELSRTSPRSRRHLLVQDDSNSSNNKNPDYSLDESASAGTIAKKNANVDRDGNSERRKSRKATATIARKEAGRRNVAIDTGNDSSERTTNQHQHQQPQFNPNKRQEKRKRLQQYQHIMDQHRINEMQKTLQERRLEEQARQVEQQVQWQQNQQQQEQDTNNKASKHFYAPKFGMPAAVLKQVVMAGSSTLKPVVAGATGASRHVVAGAADASRHVVMAGANTFKGAAKSARANAMLQKLRGMGFSSRALYKSQSQSTFGEESQSQTAVSDSKGKEYIAENATATSEQSAASYLQFHAEEKMENDVFQAIEGTHGSALTTLLRAPTQQMEDSTEFLNAKGDENQYPFISQSSDQKSPPSVEEDEARKTSNGNHQSEAETPRQKRGSLDKFLNVKLVTLDSFVPPHIQSLIEQSAKHQRRYSDSQRMEARSLRSIESHLQLKRRKSTPADCDRDSKSDDLGTRSSHSLTGHLQSLEELPKQRRHSLDMISKWPSSPNISMRESVSSAGSHIVQGTWDKNNPGLDESMDSQHQMEESNGIHPGGSLSLQSSTNSLVNTGNLYRHQNMKGESLAQCASDSQLSEAEELQNSMGSLARFVDNTSKRDRRFKKIGGDGTSIMSEADEIHSSMGSMRLFDVSKSESLLDKLGASEPSIIYDADSAGFGLVSQVISQRNRKQLRTETDEGEATGLENNEADNARRRADINATKNNVETFTALEEKSAMMKNEENVTNTVHSCSSEADTMDDTGHIKYDGDDCGDADGNKSVISSDDTGSKSDDSVDKAVQLTPRHASFRLSSSRHERTVDIVEDKSSAKHRMERIEDDYDITNFDDEREQELELGWDPAHRSKTGNDAVADRARMIRELHEEPLSYIHSEQKLHQDAAEGSYGIPVGGTDFSQFGAHCVLSLQRQQQHHYFQHDPDATKLGWTVADHVSSDMNFLKNNRSNCLRTISGDDSRSWLDTESHDSFPPPRQGKPLYEKTDVAECNRSCRRNDIEGMGGVPSFYDDELYACFDFIPQSASFLPNMTEDDEIDDYVLHAAQYRQWIGMPKFVSLDNDDYDKNYDRLYDSDD